jgi:hypothetical protein
VFFVHSAFSLLSFVEADRHLVSRVEIRDWPLKNFQRIAQFAVDSSRDVQGLRQRSGRTVAIYTDGS